MTCRLSPGDVVAAELLAPPKVSLGGTAACGGRPGVRRKPLERPYPVSSGGSWKRTRRERTPLVAHSASGSGTNPVSTAMRKSSGLASQVA